RFTTKDTKGTKEPKMAWGKTLGFFVCFVCFVVTVSSQRGAAPRAFELRADDPKFSELIAPDATLEKVAGGFGFTEGPVWSDTGFLYVSDEQKNKVSRVFPDGRVETLLEIRDPDGAAF